MCMSLNNTSLLCYPVLANATVFARAVILACHWADGTPEAQLAPCSSHLAQSISNKITALALFASAAVLLSAFIS
jgi:hypothetical protein